MTNGQVASTGPAAESASTPFPLLWRILIRPSRALADLKDRHKRSWWIPALLTLVLVAAPLVAGRAVSGGQAIAIPRADSVSMETAPGMISVSPGGLPIEQGGEPGMEETPAGPSLLTIVGALAGTVVSWLLWGGALYVMTVFMGRSSGFGQMFRLTVWTWLPYAVRGLVQTIYILATRQPIVNAGLSGLVVDRNVVSPLPPGPGQLALAGILGRVDLYLVWQVALLVLGLAVLTNLPRRKAFIATLVIWAVLTLLSIVPTILGGMIGTIG